jgi:hypothetical protein
METENAEVKVSDEQAISTHSVSMGENEVFSMDILNESNKENDPHPDVLAKTSMCLTFISLNEI